MMAFVSRSCVASISGFQRGCGHESTEFTAGKPKAHAAGIAVGDSTHWVCVDLTAIEGIDEVNAPTLVSEVGGNFSKWTTVQKRHWRAGRRKPRRCPNFKRTGGKVKCTFRLAAWSLIRSKSYLGAYLRRQRSRLGAPKAITAAAHKLARIIYNMMRFGVAYAKKEESQYADEVHHRVEKQFHRRAKELGYEVKKVEAPVEQT